MKKWGVTILIVILVGGLYYIEFSKIQSDENSNAMPTLDDLEYSASSQNWAHFYKVRATIIDGQTAEFDIPEKLYELNGKEMELEGAAVFFSPGCKVIDDKIGVHSFFLYPTLGLANACVHLPEIKMRWTIRVDLKNDWLLTKTEMIDAKAKVKGTFRIDTSKPYDSAFFLDDAQVVYVNNEEAQF